MNYFEIGNENRCGEVIQLILPHIGSGWSHIQSSGATTFNAQTLSATFPARVSEGNLIIVGLGNDAIGGTYTVMDNITSTPYQQAIVGGTNGTAAILWHIVPAGGGGSPFTVTFTSTNPTYPVMAIDEYIMPGRRYVMVNSSGASEGVGTSASLASPLTISGLNLIYCVCKAWNAVPQTITPTQDFMTRCNIPWTNSPYTNGVFAEDKINAVVTSIPMTPSMMMVNGRQRCRRIHRPSLPPSATGINPSLTLTPGSNWVMAAAAFGAPTILGWRLVI